MAIPMRSVTETSPSGATVEFGRYEASLTPVDVAWTQHKIPDLLKVGDLVYVKVSSLAENGKAEVELEQDTGTQGALLAIDNATGEIKAMVGGRDFNFRNSTVPRRLCVRSGHHSSPTFTQPPSIKARRRMTPYSMRR